MQKILRWHIVKKCLNANELTYPWWPVLISLSNVVRGRLWQPHISFLFSFQIPFIFNLEKINDILFSVFYGLKSHKIVKRGKTVNFLKFKCKEIRASERARARWMYSVLRGREREPCRANSRGSVEQRDWAQLSTWKCPSRDFFQLSDCIEVHGVHASHWPHNWGKQLSFQVDRPLTLGGNLQKGKLASLLPKFSLLRDRMAAM